MPALLIIYERANAGAFNRDKRRDGLQFFRNAASAGIEVKKPIFPVASVSAPESAPRRRDVDVHADAVTDHRNVRQPCDQLPARDFTLSVGQIIRMKS